uniref:Uncharacterized protein n=1 Tax=Arundo donax TaxID=35708 RepID=A0A0A9BWK4_ARUDO
MQVVSLCQSLWKMQAVT